MGYYLCAFVRAGLIFTVYVCVYWLTVNIRHLYQAKTSESSKFADVQFNFSQSPNLKS
jgi:hypothetical protein